MGYDLGEVALRGGGFLLLEQRGDGIEFTLYRTAPDGAVMLREVFKMTDDSVRDLIERLQLGLPQSPPSDHQS